METNVIAEVIIHEDEENHTAELREKLKQNGFKLNDVFPDFIIPIKGTRVDRMRDKHNITFRQFRY